MSTRCKKWVSDQFCIPKSLKHLSFHLHGYVTKAWLRQYCCMSSLNSMRNLLSSHYLINKIEKLLNKLRNLLSSQCDMLCHIVTFLSFITQIFLFLFHLLFHTSLLYLFRPSFSFLSISKTIVCVMGKVFENSWIRKAQPPQAILLTS